MHEGWNHFVYIGAEVDVAVGLESLDGQFKSFAYYNGEAGSGWSAYGAPDTPDWVRGFTTLEPCQTYFINMTADATLEPPQP
ncbi:MAG: hypothetical protein U5Q44_07640 [Dehalococcoidia bacterium]|nr:hypothetical protein [Dehalococcoidia bacterium]